jgi:hypothetical protein
MNNITTQSTSRETMDISPIILHETGSTRLLFFPKWVETSDNHLRGGFRFEKKGRNESWEEFEGNSITTLHRDEAYELNLNGEDMATLFSNLEMIKATLEQSGHQSGQALFQFVEGNAGSVLLQVGDSENQELVIEKLRELESQKFSSIENAVALAKIQNAIQDIEANMDNSDESFWQTFFEDRPWILQQIFHFPFYYLNGETYLGGKNTQGRSGAGGVATDFLLRNGSNDSFAIIEIKAPTKKLIGSEYRGDREGAQNLCHSMSPELSGAIVQTANQVRVGERDFRTMLGEDYPELNQTDATGVLLIGDKTSLDLEQLRSFNLFRKSLSGVVITYDELLEKLKTIKAIHE